MKKTEQLILCFLVLLTIQANGQPIQNDGYIINGTVKGIDSGMVRMLSPDGNGILDSAVIAKGKFFMQGKIGTPQQLRFIIDPGDWGFGAFVEDAHISLTIDTAGAEHYDNGHEKWAMIWQIEETGSELSDVYTRFENETNLQYYRPVFLSLRKQLRAVKGNEDATIGVKQQMDSVAHLLMAQQKVWIENYINQHPSSIAGVYLFNEFYQTFQDIPFGYLQTMLDKFSGAAQTSVYYKQLTDIAAKLKELQPNSPAPDFTLLKRDKTKFKLSSTRGSYTLIDFWASWCVPCRKAIPNWKKVYAQYHQKGLNIVSVSDDRNWDNWIKALDKEQMPWIQVIDEFPDKNKPALVGELYGGKPMPFYVLIDKEGKVILASDDEEAIRKKIDGIFQ